MTLYLKQFVEMKKNLFSLLPLLELIFVSSLLVACSNAQARFAKDVPGVWQSTPETFTDNSALTASIIDTYEFAPASMTASETLTGALTITGMVNTTTQIVADSSFVEPLSLSASAVTSISGSWTVIDDDEISISLDLGSLMVDVDPKGVVTNTSPLMADSPAIDALRPALVRNLEHSIRTALTTRYASLRHMDDIKIKGSLFKYEIGHEDFVLTRQ